jgi:hypothetical protein
MVVTIKMVRKSWTCSSDGGNMNCMQNAVEETSWNAATLKPRKMYEDNIKIDLTKLAVRVKDGRS